MNIALAIAAVAPHANATTWAAAIAPFAAKRQINTARRSAAFIGQCAAEFGFDDTQLVEDGYYSAKGIVACWPSRFPTLASALPYQHDAEKLFNHVYCNRMGNGDEASGDGYLWRGRGCTQVTGREEYTGLSQEIGVALADLPAYMVTEIGAADAATWDFVQRGRLNLADAWAITALSISINGGTIGIAERLSASCLVLGVLDPTDRYGTRSPTTAHVAP